MVMVDREAYDGWVKPTAWSFGHGNDGYRG